MKSRLKHTICGLKVPEYMHGRPFLGPHATAPEKFAVGIRDRLDETLEVTRWLNDGRFHYIRSYRTEVPFDQQTLTSFYNGGADYSPDTGWFVDKEAGVLCREIRSLKAAGRLNPLQEQYWGNMHPAEALYDSLNDPWNQVNLAPRPEYQEQLGRMRQQLRTWMLEQRDLGFWPEPELFETEKHAAPFDEARKAGVYPLERILETAELGGSGPSALPELLQRLQDPNSIVRYWAVAGLHALNVTDRMPAVPALMKALADSAASVRIEAAATLAGHEETEAAFALLSKELSSSNEWAACRAARALEMLGERARPCLTALQQARVRENDLNYGFSFSLQTAISNLTTNSH